MRAAMPNIFPYPQRLGLTGGTFRPSRAFELEVAEAAGAISDETAEEWRRELMECRHSSPDDSMPLSSRRSGAAGDTAEQTLRLARNDQLRPEGYQITISESGVHIVHADAAGEYYAFKTLKQIFCQYGDDIPTMRLEDWPDFPLRGILLDIGRGKVPQMKTLYALVDLLASLKINHLELYMEGLAFAYEGYIDYFPNASPISAREIQLLDQYARRRFIDLVPNQNCLGHMEAWLAVPAFASLAETPEGVAIVPGLPPDITTLNPCDPRSLSLVRHLFNELLPNFQSKLVNINMDEPFELGKGRSKACMPPEGVGGTYLQFLEKVVDLVRAQGKQPLMWADFIFAHPELLERLPAGITVLDWLYEGDASFEAHARQLQAHQIPYILCPGTSSWNSIAGRTDNMKANIRNAAEVGRQYGARGIITTDWGDSGHWQCLPVSYPGFAYGAAYAWNLAGNRSRDAADFLDRHVFQDRRRVMGRFWEDLGNYYKFERVIFPNRTLTFLALSPVVDWKSREDFRYKLSLYHKLAQVMAGSYGNVQTRPGMSGVSEDYDYAGLRAFLDGLEVRLAGSDPHCPDALTVKQEALFTLRMVRHGADIYLLVNELYESPALRGLLNDMLEEIEALLESFSHLWLQRYRGRWLEAQSCSGFHILLTKYKTRLAQLSQQEQAATEAMLPA